MPQLLIFGCRFDCGKEERSWEKVRKKKTGRRNERVKKQRS